MKLERDTLLKPLALQSEEDAEFCLVSVMQGKLEDIYRTLDPQLISCSEFELCDKVDPTPSDYKMREQFHEEVKLARSTGKKVRLTAIYNEVVSKPTFFEWYLSNPLKVAFFTRPVLPYNAYYDAIFKTGLRKLFLFVRDYDLDPKQLAQFMKIVEKAGDRVIGPVAQRIQMHQKQEVTHTAKIGERNVDPDDPISLQAKVDEMQFKLQQMNQKKVEAPKVVDVEFED